MHETIKKLKNLSERINRAVTFLDLPSLKNQIKELEEKTLNPNFWDNQKEAASISQKLENTRKLVETWEGIQKEAKDFIEIGSLIKAEDNPEEAEEFKVDIDQLSEKFKPLEVQTFLSEPYDKGNALLLFHVGTGGIDAQDFAEMLMRMYLRFAEKNNFKVTVLDKSVGEEAGIKSATVQIEGPFAYGLLRGEQGVHRLVRQSPFNSKNTRETSFAQVEVLPQIEEELGVEINKDDLKIDVYRASGHGGQSVNTTDSAVRITHLPTGIVVTCQNERSQHQNKDHALKVLQTKLIKLKEEEKAETINDLKSKAPELSWGHQIRSYVLHPYKMVKDHRTDFESNKADKILDGDIIEFIEAYLERKK